MAALIQGPQKVYISDSGSERVYFQVVEKNDILEIVYKTENLVGGSWKGKEISRDRIAQTTSNMRAINSDYFSETFLSFLKGTDGYKTAVKQSV